MKTLFDADRLSLDGAIGLTVDSLLAYGERYEHWAIAFSGGKDSTALVTVVVFLIVSGRLRKPQTLTVLYADTRMELPPLQICAMAILDALRKIGVDVRVVLPDLDDRFFVYMLGRGVPPPKNRFRWCTPQLKIEPMLGSLRDLRHRAGGKILMLTGVRIGESAARDDRIALSCSRDGSECGQGWFQAATPESVADTLAPLLHWRICNVWEWLTAHAPAAGFPTAMLIADSYGGKNDLESLIESHARTGCIGCPLASKDGALDRVLLLPQWKYLAPLKRLRPLYEELGQHKNRLRKANEERRADGSIVSNPGRIGPLCMEARRRGLAEVLAIQAEVNAAADAASRPPIDILNAEEISRIEELIAANTWPQRWTGNELPGNAEVPQLYADGSLQRLLWESESV